MNKYWKTASVLISIVAIITSTYVAYDIFQKGNIPKHQLEITELVRSNPTSFLSDLEGKFEFELITNNEKITNLNIIYFDIKNTGKKPILPSEYFENISVSVNKQWKIIGVSNEYSSPKGIELKWRKESKHKYFAEPILINPNDKFTVAIYVVGETPDINYRDTVRVNWNARIYGLQAISFQKPETLSFKHSNQILYVVVILYGWAIFFTIIYFMLILAASLFLSYKANILPNVSAYKLIYIVLIATLSISVSEVFAFYTCKQITGAEAWINWLILAIGSLVFIYLSFKAIQQNIHNKKAPIVGKDNIK